MANRQLTPWTGSRSLAQLGRDPFASFRREMDRLFDDFLSPAEARSFAPAADDRFPSLDVEETDQSYVVTAEVPGLDEKDIQLALRDNMLEISGEKRQERKEEKHGRAYAERFYGRFQRMVPLDAEVDADKAQAKFKNGVLTVTLPKNAKAQEKSHRIEIRP
jgi:HSP20 family protein